MNDEQRYMEWLRAGQFVDITPQVNATFAMMEQNGENVRPSHAPLADKEND